MWRVILQLCQYLISHDIFKLFLYDLELYGLKFSYFISWVWIHYYHYLFLHLTVPDLDNGTLFFEYFLAYDIPGSSCTLTPALDSTISPRSPVFLGSLAESLVEDGNFSFLLFLIKIFKKILY